MGNVRKKSKKERLFLQVIRLVIKSPLIDVSGDFVCKFFERKEEIFCWIN